MTGEIKAKGKGRGRPKGAPNKKNGAPPPGHNGDSGLNEHDAQVLLQQGIDDYEKGLKAKKSEDANFKNICKKIIANLGKHAVDDIKFAITLRTKEGIERFKARTVREFEIARWDNVPVGHMDSLFPEDKREQEERDYAEGILAGMRADDAKPPKSCPNQTKWMEGWHEGTRRNAEAIKQKPDDTEFDDPPPMAA